MTYGVAAVGLGTVVAKRQARVALCSTPGRWRGREPALAIVYGSRDQARKSRSSHQFFTANGAYKEVEGHEWCAERKHTPLRQGNIVRVDREVLDGRSNTERRERDEHDRVAHFCCCGERKVVMLGRDRRREDDATLRK